ncbi:MAG: hypothetical protein PHW24_03150 [Candidatus Moranbacteria bacterium]|nr:hypothetical protein [Candidatus Moranbacteria bacterium]
MCYNCGMDKIKIKNILLTSLLYYSTALSMVLVFVGFYLAKTQGGFLNVVLFVPIPVSLALSVIKNHKENKENKKIKK